MKSFTKISILAFVLTVFSFASVASGYDYSEPNSKIVQKAKEAVANASDSDWETLAQSAEICFMKNENVEEASSWIDKSIKIKETPYNLEVKGDYLASIGKNYMATECYFKAIQLIKSADPMAENTHLQQKIWDLR